MVKWSTVTNSTAKSLSLWFSSFCYSIHQVILKSQNAICFLHILATHGVLKVRTLAQYYLHNLAMNWLRKYIENAYFCRLSKNISFNQYCWWLCYITERITQRSLMVPFFKRSQMSNTYYLHKKTYIMIIYIILLQCNASLSTILECILIANYFSVITLSKDQLSHKS